MRVDGEADARRPERKVPAALKKSIEKASGNGKSGRVPLHRRFHTTVSPASRNSNLER